MEGEEMTMIELTEQQRQSIQQGEPLRVSAGNLDLILIRADVFASLQTLLETAAGRTESVNGPHDVAKKVTEFRLSVAALRKKAQTTPPPQAWFDESLDDLF
jgi:hypothetical protein